MIAYGSSLGAYAAIYFGGCIDARIIGGSPMLPAWRRLGNRKYADLTITHDDLVNTRLSSHAPVVLVDPHLGPDMLMVDEMIRPAYPDLRLVTVPYGGHTVFLTLQPARILKPLIVTLIEMGEVMNFDPPGEGMAMYHAERGRALKRSDPEAAIVELEKSLAITAATQPYCNLLAILLNQGDIAGIQSRVDAAKASGQARLRIVPSLAA